MLRCGPSNAPPDPGPRTVRRGDACDSSSSLFRAILKVLISFRSRRHKPSTNSARRGYHPRKRLQKRGWDLCNLPSFLAFKWGFERDFSTPTFADIFI